MIIIESNRKKNLALEKEQSTHPSYHYLQLVYVALTGQQANTVLILGLKLLFFSIILSNKHTHTYTQRIKPTSGSKKDRKIIHKILLVSRKALSKFNGGALFTFNFKCIQISEAHNVLSLAGSSVCWLRYASIISISVLNLSLVAYTHGSCFFKYEHWIRHSCHG